MSNLLLKAAQFAIRTHREEKRKNKPDVRKEDLPSAKRGGMKYLGNSIEVRFTKLPFVHAAEITVTDNKRGVRASRVVSYPEGYLNVYYAFSDGAFEKVIADLTSEIKAI